MSLARERLRWNGWGRLGESPGFSRTREAALLGLVLLLLEIAGRRLQLWGGLRLPAALRTALNWLSVVCLAAFAVLMAALAWFVIEDSRAYQSVSQTPWATPLVYPQSAWLVGLILFALVSAGYALRATWLLVRGDVATLNHEFGPRTTKDEVDEELQDLRARSEDNPVPPTSAPARAQA